MWSLASPRLQTASSSCVTGSHIAYREHEVRKTLTYIQESIFHPDMCCRHINTLADLLNGCSEKHEIIKYQVHIHDLFLLVMDNFKYIVHTDVDYQVTYESHTALVSHLAQKLGHHLDNVFCEKMFAKISEHINHREHIDWTVHLTLQLIECTKERVSDRFFQKIFDLFLYTKDCRFWKVLDVMMHSCAHILLPSQIQCAFHEATRACGTGIVSEHLAVRIVEKYFYVLREMDVQKAFDIATDPVCTQSVTDMARAPVLAAKIEIKVWKWLRCDQQESIALARQIARQSFWEIPDLRYKEDKVVIRC